MWLRISYNYFLILFLEYSVASKRQNNTKTSMEVKPDRDQLSSFINNFDSAGNL